MSAEVTLPLRIGPRTVGRFRRRLLRRPVSLAEALAAELPPMPALGDEADGYLVTSLPTRLLAPLLARQPGLRPFVRQRYRRCYARLDQGFDAYLAGFSAKSRSTLKRKRRKLADRCGGTLDLRCYRTPDEIASFHRLARALSATTYQEKLIDMGLPDGPDALAGMRALAAADAARGWLLFVDGRAAAYLYAPADGDTLLYAYMGYDPAFADLSPGTVLLFEALAGLMEEQRFALFDFTEGEGPQKRLFATDSVECVDILLLRPSLPNLFAGGMLTGFDAAVASAKRSIQGFRGRLSR